MKKLLTILLYNSYKIIKYIINKVITALSHISNKFCTDYILNLRLYKILHNLFCNQYLSIYLYLLLCFCKNIMNSIKSLVIFIDNIIENWPHAYYNDFLPCFKKICPYTYILYKQVIADIFKFHKLCNERFTLEYYYWKYENAWWKLILHIILLLFFILPIIWILKFIWNIYKYFIIYSCLICDVIFLDFILRRFTALSKIYTLIRTWVYFLLYTLWASSIPKYVNLKLRKMYKIIFYRKKKRRKSKPVKRRSYRRFFRPKWIYFQIWNVSTAMKERVIIKKTKLKDWIANNFEKFKLWWKDFKWYLLYKIRAFKPTFKNFIKCSFVKFLWNLNYVKGYPFTFKIYLLWIRQLIIRFINFCYKKIHWYSFRFRIFKIRFICKVKTSLIWWKYRFFRRFRIIRYTIWWYSKYTPLLIKRLPIFIYEYIIWYIRWFKRWIRIIPKWYFRMVKVFIKAIPRYISTFYFAALYDIRIKRRTIAFRNVLLGLYIRYRFKIEYRITEPVKFKYYAFLFWSNHKILQFAFFFLNPPVGPLTYNIKIAISKMFILLIDNKLTNKVYLIIPYRIRHFLNVFFKYNNVRARIRTYFSPIIAPINIFKDKMINKYKNFWKNIITKTKLWDKRIIRNIKPYIIGLPTLEKKKIFTTYAVILVWTWEIIKLIVLLYLIYTFAILFIYYYCKLYIYFGITLPSIKSIFLLINIL